MGHEKLYIENILKEKHTLKRSKHSNIKRLQFIEKGGLLNK